MTNTANNFNARLRDLPDEELHREISILTILRGGLDRFIPQDQNTRALMDVTVNRLECAKQERGRRYSEDGIESQETTEGPVASHQ